MADGPYRHYGGAAGQQQQQQQFYYQHGHQSHPRHITRNSSPASSSRNQFHTDTPSPSRSPGPQHPTPAFGMFNQGHTQGSMINGGGGHQRFMQMNVQHKYQQQPHQHHHAQQNPHHQPNHGGHPGHTGIGHQHSFSGGISLSSTQYGGPLQNGSLSEDGAGEIGETQSQSENWHQQLQLFAEHRQSSQTSHRHSRKGGASLVTKSSVSAQTDDTIREVDIVEHKPSIPINGDSRQDWDGMDMSGQGLRCLAPRLFLDYSFLTKLFVDNNKITSLPPSISSLRALTHLDASNNQIREIPETIGMLSRLERLILFDNNIRSLPSEIGYLFRLEMLAIEGNPLDEDVKNHLIQHGTQPLVTKLRDHTDPGPPPKPRPLIVLDDSEAAETFTVLDHNILCDRYATRSQYKYTPERALQWGYRRDLILEEIKSHDADFVCLQEVDQENFNHFFRRELAFNHYKGIFWPKSRARTMSEQEAKLVDGCAIFYKGKKFICLDKQLVDFGNTAINRPDMKGEHDIFNRIMPRDHIAVVALFENRMVGSRMIVANAHLLWDPKFTDVKLVQTAILMDQVTKLANKWASFPPCGDKSVYRHTEQDAENGAEVLELQNAEPAPSMVYPSGSQIPIIICGDFNCSNETGVFELLSKGSVASNHTDFADKSYGNFTREGISHPFNLKSAYAGEPTDFMEFTNYTPEFSGCLDYIWHSTSLRRRKLLGNVDFDYLQKIPGFPHFYFPSDHLPLFAEFSVEPRKERPAVTTADFGPSRTSKS